MKPFLLLATRTDETAAHGEITGFRQFGGMAPQELQVWRLERDPLPELDLSQYSGILLGGSPFNVSDKHKSAVQQRVEADLARVAAQAIEADFPFFGACFGVGTLGVSIGALVDRTYGEEPTAVTLEVTEEGRLDPLLAQVPDSFSAIVGHKEAITTLPAQATLLVRGQGCPVQMFRLKTNVYATQFHPELDAQGLAERLAIYADAGYCDPAEAAGLVAQARAAQIDSVHTILRTFVERYRR